VGNPVIVAGPSGSWDDSWIVGGTLSYIDGVFHYWYGAQQAGSDVWQIGFARLQATLLGIAKPGGKLTARYRLEQNFPNPCNPTSEIIYQISEIQHVTLVLYDLLGRKVKTLVDEEKRPGTFVARFDGTNLSSGVYFYRLTAGSFIQTKRLTLLK